MELYLNELSLTPPSPDRTTARAGLLSLQETVQAAVRCGLPSVLRVHQDFWAVQFAESYLLKDWLADPTIERERKQQLRSAVSKAPFLEKLHEQAEEKHRGLAEACWEGRPGLGIGLAAMNGHPVVSLPASAFCVDPLQVVVRYVREEEEETATNEDLCNLYSPAIVERRGPWIARRQQEELPSGAEVIRVHAELLDRLDFTDNAIDQLMKLRGNERTFPFVVRHLFALNQRAREWDGTAPFSDGYPFGCSDESSSTLAKYSEERTFRCPDGVRRVFSWHSKISYEKWRIHFIDSPATRRVLIGYIGKHLPIAG